MNWLEQWRALSARIEGLIRAGEFVLSAFKVNSSDTFSIVRKSLIPEFQAILAELETFKKNHATELPPQAATALATFLGQGWHGFDNNQGSVNIQILAPLAAFRSQFDYVIRDSEIEMVNLTELAFEHLCRIIVVNSDVQQKWAEAFQKHETWCERLGAVHLMGHGIWAFKVSTTGGATDLVYSDPIQERSETIKRTARALVLTEWKRVIKPDGLEAKAKEGRSQADLYSAGILGDTELKRTRYIVLLTKSNLPAPRDVVLE
ncbi:MAG: hypothetical protein HYW04_01730, partial [Deltaproteobacteria bacterium]|nr:hypothetical protein [Deltaproteobacteria bacterium]